MKIGLKLVSLLPTALLLLTGCNSYVPNQIYDLQKSSDTKIKLDKEGRIDINALLNLADKDRPSVKEFTAYAMSLSDQYCNFHKAGIFASSDAFNVGLGTLSILFFLRCFCNYG